MPNDKTPHENMQEGESTADSEQLNEPSTEEATPPPAVETTNEGEELPAIHYKPETEAMEVHHHAHHDHGKRNWKSYFWEFLMLFLAVFCGFLAEYQLEHKIERDREKKFIQLLAQDLQSDIDSIDKIKIHRLERHQQADSLLTALKNGSYKTNGANVYYWGRNTSRRRFFYSADGTFQQLKNSGSLRLVGKKDIIQKIIEYDVIYRNYVRQLEVEMMLVEDYRLMAAKIFDAKIFQTISGENISQRPAGNPQLFDDSPASINEFANKINFLAGSQYRLTQLLNSLRFKATEVLAIIKKEYKLP
jgi:hypothetical protein